VSYAVKEIFYTLQGEGHNAGRAAVFCRFSGCNLWSGREIDRPSAVCQFCDTDFVGIDGLGGGRFDSAKGLAAAINGFWPSDHSASKFVVCTGGEPLLQLNEELIAELHEFGFEVAIETNGTLPVPEMVDWVCVSPKHGTELAAQQGNEIKVVFPQKTDPRQYEVLHFDHYFIQAMDGPDQSSNMQKAIQFCLENPRWKLSLQTHKLLNLR
jgi:7-carboxy-7-deazaguanine synthase (Cx14CxxC type)